MTNSQQPLTAEQLTTIAYWQEKERQRIEIQKVTKEVIRRIVKPFGDVPSIWLGRNDPCHCGSGRKFKKCCRIKQKGDA